MRPYIEIWIFVRINHHKPVHMIGHNHPFIETNFLPNFNRSYPFIRHDLPKRIQSHFTLNNLPE